MRGLFITGTDTDCGKTAVGCALARSAQTRGLRVRVVKPVETGCTDMPNDALELAKAAGDMSELDQICPYRFTLPAAPEVAAAYEERQIDLGHIIETVRRAKSESDLVLVEGAGGLRVPLGKSADMGDLASLLDLPLLVVARAAVGTLNHTLLTLDNAASRGLRVAGVVFSETRPMPESDRLNLEALRQRLPVPELGLLPFNATQLVPEFGWIRSLRQ